MSNEVRSGNDSVRVVMYEWKKWTEVLSHGQSSSNLSNKQECVCSCVHRCLCLPVYQVLHSVNIPPDNHCNCIYMYNQYKHSSMLYAGAYTTYVTLFKMVTTANTITSTRTGKWNIYVECIWLPVVDAAHLNSTINVHLLVAERRLDFNWP